MLHRSAGGGFNGRAHYTRCVCGWRCDVFVDPYALVGTLLHAIDTAAAKRVMHYFTAAMEAGS